MVWVVAHFVASRDFGLGNLWVSVSYHPLQVTVLLCSLPFIKATKESMQRKAMLAAEVHRSLMVKEKVKRCEIEHRFEQRSGPPVVGRPCNGNVAAASES